MKVLLINGSPNENGSTFTALSEIAGTLEGEGIGAEIFHIGKGPVQGCIDCRNCSKTGKCVFENDVVSDALEKARESDGFVFGSPVYYGGVTGQMTAFLNRLYFSGRSAFMHKVGAAITICRRAGSTSTLEQLNKYLLISEMILVGSQYWAMVHGNNGDELRRDLEGMQTMRVLGRNMAWVLKSIQAGKDAGVPMPKQEEQRFWTNFIE